MAHKPNPVSINKNVYNHITHSHTVYERYRITIAGLSNCKGNQWLAKPYYLPPDPAVRKKAFWLLL